MRTDRRRSGRHNRSRRRHALLAAAADAVADAAADAAADAVAAAARSEQKIAARRVLVRLDVERGLAGRERRGGNPIQPEGVAPRLFATGQQAFALLDAQLHLGGLLQSLAHRFGHFVATLAAEPPRDVDEDGDDG